MRDLTGERFGTLTVQRMIRVPGRKPMAACTCDCGLRRNVRAAHLTGGRSRSCHRRHWGGQEVGDLLVLEPTPDLPSKSGRPRTAWRCRCLRCGVEIAVSTAYLSQGTARHCSGRYGKPPLPPRSNDAEPLPAPIAERAPTAVLKKVRALKDGFYGLLKRRAGDVFQLTDDSAFSARWMVRVPDATPSQVTSAPDALRRQHDHDGPLGRVRVVSRPAEADDEGGVQWDFDPYDFDSNQR
jgi:hypothetical protein